MTSHYWMHETPNAWKEVSLQVRRDFERGVESIVHDHAKGDPCCDWCLVTDNENEGRFSFFREPHVV